MPKDVHQLTIRGTCFRKSCRSPKLPQGRYVHAQTFGYIPILSPVHSASYCSSRLTIYQWPTTCFLADQPSSPAPYKYLSLCICNIVPVCCWKSILNVDSTATWAALLPKIRNSVGIHLMMATLLLWCSLHEPLLFNTLTLTVYEPPCPSILMQDAGAFSHVLTAYESGASS
jgi:hypothetical protein